MNECRKQHCAERLKININEKITAKMQLFFFSLIYQPDNLHKIKDMRILRYMVAQYLKSITIIWTVQTWVIELNCTRDMQMSKVEKLTNDQN